MTSPFGKKTTEKKEDIKTEIDDLIKDRELPVYEAEPKETEPMFEEPEEEKEEPVGKTKKRVRVRKKPEPKEEEEPKRKLKAKHKKKLVMKQRVFDWNRALLYSLVFGIIVIIFFSQELEAVNPVMMWIMVLFGMMAFFPLGLLIGKLFLDPYIRCKIYRRMGNRNFGMVHLIQKGGKKVEIRIKNLTDDVIIQGTKLWVLEDGGIYYSDRDDNLIMHSRISSASITTSPNNVPMLFLDAETMLPLRLHRPETISNPQQVGATVLGYINNQIAKNLFFKKSMTMFYFIILALQCANIIGLIVLYDELVGI